MLTECRSWKEIGEVIGWCPITAQQHYEKWTELKLKSWPENTIALICCRIGDPYWNGMAGSVERSCWNCNHPVMASLDTVTSSEKHSSKIICVHCAATYARVSSKKCIATRDVDRAIELLKNKAD